MVSHKAVTDGNDMVRFNKAQPDAYKHIAKYRSKYGVGKKKMMVPVRLPSGKIIEREMEVGLRDEAPKNIKIATVASPQDIELGKRIKHYIDAVDILVEDYIQKNEKIPNPTVFTNAYFGLDTDENDAYEDAVFATRDSINGHVKAMIEAFPGGEAEVERLRNKVLEDEFDQRVDELDIDELLDTYSKDELLEMALNNMTKQSQIDKLAQAYMDDSEWIPADELEDLDEQFADVSGQFLEEVGQRIRAMGTDAVDIAQDDIFKKVFTTAEMSGLEVANAYAQNSFDQWATHNSNEPDNKWDFEKFFDQLTPKRKLAVASVRLEQADGLADWGDRTETQDWLVENLPKGEATDAVREVLLQLGDRKPVQRFDSETANEILSDHAEEVLEDHAPEILQALSKDEDFRDGLMGQIKEDISNTDVLNAWFDENRQSVHDMEKAQQRHTRTSKLGKPFEAGRGVMTTTHHHLPNLPSDPKVEAGKNQLVNQVYKKVRSYLTNNGLGSDTTATLGFVKKECDLSDDPSEWSTVDDLANDIIVQIRSYHNINPDTEEAPDFEKAEHKKPYGHKQYSRKTPTGKIAQVPAKGVKPVGRFAKVNTIADLENLGIGRVTVDISGRGGGVGFSGSDVAKYAGVDEGDLPNKFGAGCNYLGGGLRGAIFPSTYSDRITGEKAKLLDALAEACVRAYKSAEDEEGMNEEEVGGETNWEAKGTNASRRAGIRSAYDKSLKKKPYGHEQYSRTTPTGKVSQVPAKGVKPEKDYYANPQQTTDSFLDGMKKNFAKLQAQDQEAKAKGTIVGRYITEPIADGNATYKILGINRRGNKVKIRVVTGIGDDWRVPYWGEETWIDRAYAENGINFRDNMQAYLEKKKG